MENWPGRPTEDEDEPNFLLTSSGIPVTVLRRLRLRGLRDNESQLESVRRKLAWRSKLSPVTFIGTMSAATASACLLIRSSGVGSRGVGSSSTSTVGSYAGAKASQQEVSWTGLRTRGVRGRALLKKNRSSSSEEVEDFLLHTENLKQTEKQD